MRFIKAFWQVWMNNAFWDAGCWRRFNLPNQIKMAKPVLFGNYGYCAMIYHTEKTRFWLCKKHSSHFCIYLMFLCVFWINRYICCTYISLWNLLGNCLFEGKKSPRVFCWVLLPPSATWVFINFFFSVMPWRSLGRFYVWGHHVLKRLHVQCSFEI